MAAAPFYFQILLTGLKGVPPELANRSIVIEVGPEEISRATLAGEKEKPERDLAERIARRVAAEVIQSESVFGPEQSNSIAQIGSLPEVVREKSPTLQRAAVRAWLV